MKLKMDNFIMKCALLVVFGAHIGQSGAAKSFPHMPDYFKMPKLSIFDDYDRCFEGTTEKMTYCVVDSTIKPDNYSKLWHYIKELSDDHKYNFRHDRLQRGICIQWCQELILHAGNDTNYYLPKYDGYDVMKYDPNHYRNGISNSILYNDLVNECVNYKLKREHNLMAYSTIEYCVTNKDVHETDALHVLFVVLVVGIVMTVLMASLYDHYLLQYSDSLMLEDKIVRPSSKATEMILSFSLPRNWERLMRDRNEQDVTILDYVDPLRFLSMLLIMSAHTIYFSMQYPVENPEHVEAIYYHFSSSILLNGYVIVQSFFVFSGLTQTIGFANFTEKHKTPSIKFICSAIYYRYLRLTPIYAFFILFYSTYGVNFFDGPFWPRQGQIQQYNCRKNWWANMLYINNYVNNGELCMLQSWYLSADFQLSVVGLFLLYVIWKYPELKQKLLSGVLALAILIPATITYFNGFDGVVMPEMEHNKYNMIDNLAFKRMYVPTHTNMGCYLVGIWAGLKLHKMEAPTRKLGHKITFYLVIVLGFMVIMSGYIFYVYDFEKPSVWSALYAGLQKIIFGWGMVYVMWCFSHKLENIVRKVLAMKMLHILGKLSYCAFIVHIFVIQMVFAYERRPIYIKNWTFVNAAVVSTTVSYLIALLLSLFLEYPTSALQKLLLLGGRGEHKNQKVVSKNNVAAST